MARIGWVGLAAACAVTFAAVYVVADRTLSGQRADERAFQVVYGLVPGGWLNEALSWFAREFVVEGLAGVVVVLGVAALGRRAWGALARALVCVAVPVLLSPYLRDEVLVRRALKQETFPLNSMPSTHAAAATALVVAAVLLWPRSRPVWLPNAGGVVVLLVVLGNVLSQAHRVSDVVAALLLVAGVTGAVLALAPAQSVPAG